MQCAKKGDTVKVYKSWIVIPRWALRGLLIYMGESLSHQLSHPRVGHLRCSSVSHSYSGVIQSTVNAVLMYVGLNVYLLNVCNFGWNEGRPYGVNAYSV